MARVAPRWKLRMFGYNGVMNRVAIITALLLVACADEPAAPRDTGFSLLDARPDRTAAHADRGTQRDRGLPDRAPRARDKTAALTRAQLALHWAPVWYQDSDSSDYKADYIVAYDFDGDTRSDNNWDNLHKAGSDLRAVVYYSVVETATHWFLLYADFHPRDWDENCKPLPLWPDKCHENDLEGAMVVVRKDSNRYGAFHLLYTEAHNTLHVHTNDPGVSARTTKSLGSNKVTFEQGSHVQLYVESKGHGVCALTYPGTKHCKHPTKPGANPFPGGDGIVYYPTGKAEIPSGGNDRKVGYALVPLRTTLWARRKDICDSGCTFDQKMIFEGQTLGKAFDGDTHKKDAANPPWAWDDPDDGAVYRGGFFFRPAETALTHLNIKGPFSKTYLYNPYLKGK